MIEFECVRLRQAVRDARMQYETVRVKARKIPDTVRAIAPHTAAEFRAADEALAALDRAEAELAAYRAINEDC